MFYRQELSKDIPGLQGVCSSALSRRLAPEQGTSPVGSAVEPAVRRLLRR